MYGCKTHCLGHVSVLLFFGSGTVYRENYWGSGVIVKIVYFCHIDRYYLSNKISGEINQ
jgi:hypothetical protein